ncbi:MAG: hypothetical protein ABF812_15735, partial [Gluconobacter cerinus]|uniref:hypothetical protein n=1 Tax=Gluconobacter cerinus TaxID=38307 RepID=UPI0039EB9B3B
GQQQRRQNGGITTTGYSLSSPKTVRTDGTTSFLGGKGISFLPTIVVDAVIPSPYTATTVSVIGFNAETDELVFIYSDRSQIPVRGLAAVIAQLLGGTSLAARDGDGPLILGGNPRLGISSAGNLTLPTSVPDSTADYTPVSGTNEVYSQTGALGVAQ